MKPGAEKERFVIMEPEEPYNGMLKDTSIEPTEVGGTWYPRLFRPGDEEKTVILHFHGGSFLWGTGRDAEFKPGASAILKHVPGMAHFVQYRLAHDSAGAFPAALQDAVTAYRYLPNLGVSSSNIILSGDSAGTNIALAFLRYIASPGGKDLPSPAAALLWSPSLDLAAHYDPKTVDQHRNSGTDYITGFTLVWGIDSYVPKDMTVEGPYFPPLRHPFQTETPIWIMVGGNEVLYHSCVELTDKMQGVPGNRVGLYEVPHAPHDIFFVGHILGWYKELDVAAREAAKFLAEKATV